ncbi:hypothetical protein PIB30_044452 [Stylosanthes scabra]|uniref:Uncharacterized protein n=1 Tax=Stylosanthes scabra TaxID=79078 RepID=A0ABU6SG14_9FABA|nr:hypothetical protein [Stylosanthes scabra]
MHYSETSGRALLHHRHYRFSPPPVSLEIHQLDSLQQPKLVADWAHLVLHSPRNIGAIVGDLFSRVLTNGGSPRRWTHSFRFRIPKQLQEQGPWGLRKAAFPKEVASTPTTLRKTPLQANSL